MISKTEMIPKSKDVDSSFHTLTFMYICKRLFSYLVFLKNVLGISYAE